MTRTRGRGSSGVVRADAVEARDVAADAADLADRAEGALEVGAVGGAADAADEGGVALEDGLHRARADDEGVARVVVDRRVVPRVLVRLSNLV